MPWNQTGLAAEEGGLGKGLGHSLRKPERKGSSEEEELKQRCRGEHTWSKCERLLEKLPQRTEKGTITADVCRKLVCSRSPLLFSCL